MQYFYDGNRLHRVNDNSGQGEGFNNGANQDHEFGYDGNGNLTRDYNRGIGDGGIQYNVLNLPRYLNKGGQELRYTYDATGGKRQLTAPQVSTFYAGAFEYKGDGTLLRVGLEEGQLVRNGDGSFTVHYYLKDHLGNVRVAVDESGTVVQETEYHAFGYSVSRTGADKNKYLYNGKEQQPETNFLDFGARQYEPALGRWLNIDPMSEVARRWSPYTYVYNNPLRFIDPDGMLVDPAQAANTPDGQLPRGESFDFSDGYFTQSYANSAVSKASFSGVYVTTGGGGGDGSAQAITDPPGKKKNNESSKLTTDKNAKEWYESVADHTPIGDILYEANKLNPLAILINGISALATGKDTYGIETSGAQAVVNIATILPVGRIAGVGTNVVASTSRVFEVGIYKSLVGAEKGLHAHHVGQKALMAKFIPGYNFKTAPSILVPAIGHTAGPGRISTSMQGFNNAREVLARDIFELRRVYPNIPNSSLQQLIQLNKTMYPNAFAK